MSDKIDNDSNVLTTVSLHYWTPMNKVPCPNSSPSWKDQWGSAYPWVESFSPLSPHRLNKSVSFFPWEPEYISPSWIQSLLPIASGCPLCSWVQPHVAFHGMLLCPPSPDWGYMWLTNCYQFHLFSVGCCLFSHPHNLGQESLWWRGVK